MTNRDDFVEYNRLKRKLEKEIEATVNKKRYAKLLELQRRCFPTEEQVIEEVTAFFDAEM